MPMDNTAAKILVFDSGVGGLSIVSSIRERLPDCDFIFACDNAAFPYGTKDEFSLLHRVETTLQTLISEEQPDLVVVACNTASTLVLPRIRSHFSLPIVGVVPAIKPAAEQSRSGVIGLLATPGTINRPYTDELINDFAQDCEIVKVGSSQLVLMAEAALRGSAPDAQRLKQLMAPFFEHPDLDTIVLACTHFPLLLKTLKKSAQREILWVDSGDAIARRVESLLNTNAIATLKADNDPISGAFQDNSADKIKTYQSTLGAFSVVFTSDAEKHDIDALKPSLNAMACGEIRYTFIR